MINQEMYELGAAPNAIRELFAYGLTRKAALGAENVFDYSLGNPSIPAPERVKQTILNLLEESPVALHGYTPSQGDPRARKAVADSISRRFGIEAQPNQVYMTVGAAASLAISIKAISVPGDEVIVITPYFPEYKIWIEAAGCKAVEIPAQVPSFQLDVPAIAAAINERTSAIIVNSPNNPVGVIYTREVLEELAAALTAKEEELGRKIYLISDEPYREITYGKEVPYIPCIYPRTLVCYSYSKSLSLPGQRIGYVYVSDLMDDAAEVSLAVTGAGRALGFVCAPALFQRVVAECVDEPSDVEAYATNRRILSEGLAELGYEFVEPDGAFYLWVKALEEDERAFSDRAKQYELLLVPSDSFGVHGWVRMSYCIDRDTIVRSMPALKLLKESYQS